MPTQGGVRALESRWRVVGSPQSPWYGGGDRPYPPRHGSAVEATVVPLPVRAVLWRRHGVVGRERRPESRATVPKDRPELRFRGATGCPEEKHRDPEKQE